MKRRWCSAALVLAYATLGCGSPPDTVVGGPDPANTPSPPPERHDVVVLQPSRSAGPLALADVRVAKPNRADRPGESYPALTTNGAWCWFADPRALRYRGFHDKTYLGWVTNSGEIAVASYDHVMQQSTIALIKKLSNDDHDNPALLMLPDGRLAAFYAHHCGPAMYYRITSEPEDITSWGPEQKVPVNSSGSLGYTYPNPVVLPAEGDRIFLFWRGGGWLPTFSTSETGEEWTPARILVDTEGQNRPYVKIASDGHSRIHFAFTDAHPIRVGANNIYHVFYEQGSFYRADGTLIGTEQDLPLTPSQVDLVYDASARADGPIPAWVWDIAIDSDGSPVVVFATFVSPDDHRYHYARWTGGSWSSQELVAAGASIANSDEPLYSGGIVLDHDNPNTVYLSRAQQGGVHELEKWSFNSASRSWDARAITSGSSEKNVRPVVVRNHGEGPLQLLWMFGEYEYYYKAYDTSIRYFPGSS